MSLTEREQEKEKLTTEHELYLSVGLDIPMRPSVFSKVVNDLLFENIGYLRSWGVHTKAEYIAIIDKQEKKLVQLQAENKRLKEAAAKAITFIGKTHPAYLTLKEALKGDPNGT